MPTTREILRNGWRIHLDLGPQVLGLDAPDRIVYSPRDKDVPLAPTLPSCDGQLVPAAALILKAKQFDDGLLAAVERAAQRGHGTFPGKASLLRGLAERLADQEQGPIKGALAVLFGAACLGGLDVKAPAALVQAVRATVLDFLGKDLASKPLSFHTWSPELRAIFRQDRLLQSEFEDDPSGVETVARALGADAGLRANYTRYLDLIARSTNWLAGPDLIGHVEVGEVPPGARPLGPSYFPPSRSHEADLFHRLFGNGLVPEGFDLLDELVSAVRAGTVSLAPTERSGWYDHQVWALETLAAPDRALEANRLRLSAKYRDHLRDLFKAAYGLTRETNVKQVQGGGAGRLAGYQSRPIYLAPELSAEPLVTFYLRRALSYRFIRGVLEDTFGAGSLAGLNRLTPEGPNRATLAEELDHMEGLFRGAAVIVAGELGLALPPEVDAASDPGPFQDWARRLSADGDLARDARMMVPVFFDFWRQKSKVWAFLGWTMKTVDLFFAIPPRVLKCERAGPGGESAPPEVIFRELSHDLPTPVMAEVYVTHLLDRDEFRRHCDRHRTRTAILRNLR
jgi:hypothetical protein